MSAEPEKLPLPGWLVWAGSAAIVFHLFALAIVVLAVPSGPWLVPPFGPSQADTPFFAQRISEFTTKRYLEPLQLASNYHFDSNRTDFDTVYVEAILRDSNDKVMEKIRFPQDRSNVWVWNRQVLLAQSLGADDPIEPTRGESIPAPGQATRMVFIWGVPENGIQKLEKVPQYGIPRDRPVYRPTETTRELAQSYSRFLCRQSGAKSVELIRHHRRRVFPMYLFNDPPPDAFEEIICSFGEYSLEK